MNHGKEELSCRIMGKFLSFYAFGMTVYILTVFVQKNFAVSVDPIFDS